MHPIRLGVNIDHIATVRNARGTSYPEPVRAARAVLAAGADGITMHLREDRRHIRDSDLHGVKAAIGAPLNLEMAATGEMVEIALRLRPHACCLVPEKRNEVTTEGGLDVAGQLATLAPAVGALSERGIRVSLFVDPDPQQLEAAAAVGAQVVELHTGAYAQGAPGELERLRRAAALTAELGLECHAGHGLTFANTPAVAAIPEIRELNIGHFIIGEAMFVGLYAVIRRMKAMMDMARALPPS